MEGKGSQQRTEAPLNPTVHVSSSLQAQSQNEGLKEPMAIPLLDSPRESKDVASPAKPPYQ